MFCKQRIELCRHPANRFIAPTRRSSRNHLATACLILLTAGAAAERLSASVLVTGNVKPVDNPFTQVGSNGVYGNEGLPVDGNQINPFGGQTAATQINFEFIGGYTTGGVRLNNLVTVDGTQAIVVGQSSFGAIEIRGESALRSKSLVIGDTAEIGTPPQARFGTGVVRITGFGSLYNNDPFILPFDTPDFATFGTIRDDAPNDLNGFDLYVGRAGTGTLEISAGARAEIQEAVVVGHLGGSTGSIIVDGFDSFLGSGGFEPNDANPHHTLIGRQGIGYMTIRAGGTVQSEAPALADNDGRVGAVIGGVAFTDTSPDPDDFAGGNGTVTVTGLASKWIVGGTLQVGFYDGRDAPGSVGVPDNGNLVEYNNSAGRGTLNVSDGGLVNIRYAPTPSGSPPDPDEPLMLAIGRFGRVVLNGGTINVGAGGVDQPEDPRANEVRLINDGVIEGGGRIDTGVFWNRYFGEVRVGAGETLIIDSSSAPPAAPEEIDPLVNFGLIEVIGTEDNRAEIEFVRAPITGLADLVPFINRPVATTAADATTEFDGGMISAQHATLRFNSDLPGTPPGTPDGGLANEGVMGFTAGTNIIKGFVVNQTGPSGLAPKFIIGPNTTVVVEDDFTAAAAIPPLAGAPAPEIFFGTNGAFLVVLDQKTLTLAGELTMGVSIANPSGIIASGDVGIGGTLNVSLNEDALGSLTHGSRFELISFGGEAFGIDNTGSISVPNNIALASGAAGFIDLNVSPDISALYPNLDAVSQRIGQAMYLSFLDPCQVGTVCATGPDFNGDGFVNLLDLNIWKANKGIIDGASVLQGDANGDGRVDGADYNVWVTNLGPYPGGGSGGGAGAGANVPEPTSLASLLCSGLLALAFGWRSRS